jgi:long-chain acyl-CoA synthetase
MMLTADTIVELLCRRIDASASAPALAAKRRSSGEPGGRYAWATWNEVAADVSQAVAALVSLGVQPGDRVVQISENRYEWIIVDLALHMAGAVHVPIHPTLSGPQIAWQIRHCGARVALLSGPHQAAKLAALGDDCPAGLRWVSYDACDDQLAGSPVKSLDQIKTDADLNRGIEAACAARTAARPSDLATILYTSGTTGEPKGVMLTQGNLASNACATIEAFGYVPDQLRINFLPLSHIFARTCDLYCWLVEGSRLALAESRETIIADCQAVHPTCLNGVPYFFDKVYRGLCAAGTQDVPGALKAALGGAIEKCCAGGAALPDYLYDYYHTQGLPLLQGYGLTESSPVITISTLAHHRRGSCGRAIPGVEVRIAEDGEILTRGPHVMAGYYRSEAASAEVLHGGWLATGDLGRLDDEGFLYITGRKKEILVTLGGKNIAPVYLESLLTEDPLIAQALIVGDGQPFLTALIVPNFDVFKFQLQERGLGALPLAEALVHPEVAAMFRARIDRRLAAVSPHEQVGKFTLLARPFTIDAGELTPKLSLRRHEIAAHYAAKIEAMYGNGGK